MSDGKTISLLELDRMRKKPRQLTLLKKVEILDKLKNGVKISHLAREYDVSTQSIRTMKKTEEAIRLSVSVGGSHHRKKITMMPVKSVEIAELEYLEAKKAVENRIKELDELKAIRDHENQQAGFPPEEPRFKKVEVMKFRGRPTATKNTTKLTGKTPVSHPSRTSSLEFPELPRENGESNNDGLRGKCKRMCPKCSGIVSVGKYNCDCGYSFKEEKQMKKRKRDSHLLEMGRRASKNRNLWRAFNAIEKQSIKIQAGGYNFVCLYYKECPTRNLKGIVGGEWIKKNDVDLLLHLFCNVIKSSDNEEELLQLPQDRHSEEQLAKNKQQAQIPQVTDTQESQKQETQPTVTLQMG
ncbi:hypothetical protein OTU49_003775 [Cherax quadricarinatus]|uniref:HTH psq-type domain-containing protein n=1 Tax=Cherax quadricarinatus TaxID=27406 RepID=A0AAW0XF59_CHEQU|nr:uncharacterized protein LOC128693044 isoform X2 [Cherax quadricarinatus]